MSTTGHACSSRPRPLRRKPGAIVIGLDRQALEASMAAIGAPAFRAAALALDLPSRRHRFRGP